MDLKLNKYKKWQQLKKKTWKMKPDLMKNSSNKVLTYLLTWKMFKIQRKCIWNHFYSTQESTRISYNFKSEYLWPVRLEVIFCLFVFAFLSTFFFYCFFSPKYCSLYFFQIRKKLISLNSYALLWIYKTVQFGTHF